MPQRVPAMCRSLAAQSIKADWPSGNAPTTRVGRGISRRIRSRGLFVQIKQARGFRQFLLRGLAQVAAEWSFVCSVHNVLKLAGARG